MHIPALGRRHGNVEEAMYGFGLGAGKTVSRFGTEPLAGACIWSGHKALMPVAMCRALNMEWIGIQLHLLTHSPWVCTLHTFPS